MSCYFWPILTPSLCHTLSHIPGPPKVRHTSRTPPFLVGLVKKSGQKPSCTNSLSIVRGVFSPEGLSIPLSVTIHLLQPKVKHHFKFHVYYVWWKKCISVTSHALEPPPGPPLTNCYTYSYPSPLERDVLYARPLVCLYVCIHEWLSLCM